ncbi:pyroglutamyl-peptidase I [Mycetohabitans sp. B8]|uniref:pyroglutamyl-peptidase I n=1 Tax=Mycetohabitans sp. B8 TaxID=2841845 RepID=UPI001F01A3AB|nr:pyroglutamyl-peptidase I [Mycetohabitans sp. B8]MCG1043570.1 pyroglutamyl-peptidase I [Mycetohabitans sp. B8]
MHTVLLTGFEPFENEPINPSWEAVRALDGARIATPSGDAIVHARMMPVRFRTLDQALLDAIDATRPSLAICVGQAGGRADLSVERVAINVDDARIPDNDGYQPIDAPIVAHGPAAYFSTLPIKALVHTLREAGIPASVSQTAGTFTCNRLFYILSHYIATRAPQLRGGFVHIPYTPRQAARHPSQPSLPTASVIEGLKVIVRTALSVRMDLQETGGALH